MKSYEVNLDTITTLAALIDNKICEGIRDLILELDDKSRVVLTGDANLLKVIRMYLIPHSIKMREKLSDTSITFDRTSVVGKRDDEVRLH